MDEEIGCLGLSRQPGEVVWIGAQIRVCVVSVHGKKVQLQICAPKSLRITREEMIDSEDEQEGENAE